MKRKILNVFLFAFCLSLFPVSAFYNFSVADAQTTQTSTRPRQTVSPTPRTVVSPGPQTAAKSAVSPTVSPTPDIDDPNEIIKIETEEVNLNVRVVDRNNRPINNLRQDEFKVYENNVLQPITAFSKAEVPTNYSLVIDNSGSLRQQLDKVIEAGKILIASNRPDDEASVIRFVSSEKIEILQDFTNNKPELNDALENLFIEGGKTAIIDAVYLAAERTDSYEKSRNPNDKKRRALILVSDGEDRDSFYKEPQLYELLRESDVQIYVIGFVGDLEKEGGFISKSPQGKAKAFLVRLATETGGKVYFPNSVNELNTIAQDISSELRTQYLVSYSPTDKVQDNSYRNIKVAVNDSPKKEKRIAITRSGITRSGGNGLKPTLQRKN
ncbi:MAG TPA: VWA domain-containing protein [Pyrinomonadaceae bacterium]|nr:VWA domain-containing protein [Pyrinomonadaceae bacterium]